MNNARRAKLYTAQVLIEHAKEIIAKAASEERVAADATRLEKADGNLAAVLATLNAIGVDPIGDFERLVQAGKLSPPDAEG